MEEALSLTRSLEGQHFWTVLIGNNKYNDAEQLYGCINDTELIRDYLLDNLGVSSDNILLLHDASRETITDALYDLRDNPHIQMGDHIIVHFSGHGSIYCVETGVNSADSIGAICPSDRGGDVPDVSYIEINHILSEVREVKGGKITFITDCCYSGGMARANSFFHEASKHSVTPIRLSMLEAAERHPRRNSSVFDSSEELKGEISAFVHLAACREFQQAREVTQNSKRYGAFTWELVQVLKSTGPNQRYTDIIRRIGRLNRKQVPKAIGVRKTSQLWF